jgi:CrcB protein
LRAVLAVAAGSAVGGVLRYVVGVLFVQRFGPGFPFGTLFVNVSGSFLIGVVVELAQTRALGVTPFLRVALATGFVGGYTTFSAYAYETFTLGADGEAGLALAYAGGSVVLGLTAFYLGVVVARLIGRTAA